MPSPPFAVGVGDVLLELFLVAITVTGVALLPRMWRNDAGFHSDQPHPVWPWGKRTWRAMTRCVPLCFPIFAIGAVWYPIDLSIDQDGTAHEIGTYVFGIPIVANLVALVTVFLFNRPKFLVAPHHRHQKGLVLELFGRRSAPTPAPRRPPAWHSEPGGEDSLVGHNRG
jgi:hypothetical protein